MLDDNKKDLVLSLLIWGHFIVIVHTCDKWMSDNFENLAINDNGNGFT